MVLKTKLTLLELERDRQRQESYADHLVDDALESEDILATDPIVVHALYARRAKKSDRQRHIPMSVSVDFQPHELLAKRIYHLFQDKQQDWSYSAAEEITRIVMAEYPDVFPERRRAALTWYAVPPQVQRINETDMFASYRELFAYRQVVDAHSAVRLRVISLDGNLQFAMFANRNIRSGEFLWELMGMMPIDSNGGHSKVSEMSPFKADARVLIGPIRFVNHQCRTFNCEVSIH